MAKMKNNIGGEYCGMCNCGCFHHKIIPVLVVLFGLVFLAAAYGWVSTQFRDIAWPILVILAGIVKLTGRMCKCC